MSENQPAKDGSKSRASDDDDESSSDDDRDVVDFRAPAPASSNLERLRLVYNDYRQTLGDHLEAVPQRIALGSKTLSRQASRPHQAIKRAWTGPTTAPQPPPALKLNKSSVAPNPLEEQESGEEIGRKARRRHLEGRATDIDTTGIATASNLGGRSVAGAVGATAVLNADIEVDEDVIDNDGYCCLHCIGDLFG